MMLTSTSGSIARFIGTVTDGISGVYVPTDDLETQVSSLALRTVVTAIVLLLIFVTIAATVKDKVPPLKLPLFLSIALTMSISTILLISSTIYLNVKADSGGPVHWHADIEFWACGNQLELRNPTGMLSNKIGSATLHEHDDQRIHLEGVVVEKEADASLGKFMHVIKGAITDEALVLPVNDTPDMYFEDHADGDGATNSDPTAIQPFIVDDGENGKFVRILDGQNCGNQESNVQVFVYTFDSKTNTYSQQKITRPQDYVIAPSPNVPPGDCIIVEFGPTKSRTDKLCEQYGIRDKNRCEQFGVDANKREICTAEEKIVSSSETTTPASTGTLSAACREYLENQSNELYRPSLTSAQMDDCDAAAAQSDRDNTTNADCAVAYDVTTGTTTTSCPTDTGTTDPDGSEPQSMPGSRGAEEVN